MESRVRVMYGHSQMLCGTKGVVLVRLSHSVTQGGQIKGYWKTLNTISTSRLLNSSLPKHAMLSPHLPSVPWWAEWEGGGKEKRKKVREKGWMWREGGERKNQREKGEAEKKTERKRENNIKRREERESA